MSWATSRAAASEAMSMSMGVVLDVSGTPTDMAGVRSATRACCKPASDNTGRAA